MVRESLLSARKISELVMCCVCVGQPNPTESKRLDSVRWLADAAVRMLVEEADLTPKPGLVDKRGFGAHPDMNLEMLHRSAYSLQATFRAIASRAFGAVENVSLRESLSEIGRQGERTMLQVTGGVNTHRGAIWTLGLLCAGAAMLAGKEQSAEKISAQAARIARLPDSYTSNLRTHGQQAYCRYGVRGARGEAEGGFRHVIEIGLPMLKKSRLQGLAEEHARLNALVAMIAELNDTCLLHRGGPAALTLAKRGARRILDLGGVANDEGLWAVEELDRQLVQLRASPGGSADLLAAALFLDHIESHLV
jgi:triphosphoribosyl-dephospho-CoA synthase